MPEADRVVIRVSNHEIQEIRDATRIAAITRFVDRYRDGWDQPWYGIPVADVTAGFYRGDSILGYFGVGWSACHDEAGFFETMRFERYAHPGHGSHAATISECQDFINLLGVPGDNLPKPKKQ